MKSIEISGKRNIDSFNQDKQPTRSDALKYKFNVEYYEHKTQIKIVNKLYLNEQIDHESSVKREINKKISGYKNQDVQKNLVDLVRLISFDQVIELLVDSKLQCFYCKDKCELLYTDCFSKKQWTLDRIDNSIGHNHDNVVVCCLDCNIKRGDMDSNRFKKGKEIKIVRKQF